MTTANPRTFDGKPIHGPGGISAVVLRRGGKLVEFTVAELLLTGDPPPPGFRGKAIPRSATKGGRPLLVTKKPKRKGAKR